MIPTRHVSLLALLGGLGALPAMQIAWAQTATPAAEPAVPLPAISVEGQAQPERADGPVEGYRATRSATGTKTDTAIKDVPQTINVVPRQVIEDRQITSLVDALYNTPNVIGAGTNGGRGQNFFVRGFQTQTMAIDGVMQSPALNFPLVTRDLSSAERVEVLKGPASVLYGRNEPGGLVNVVTRKPTDTFTGGATLQGGSYDFFRGESTVSGPLDAKGELTARMTAAYTTAGSFRYANDDTLEYIAPVLNWAPREDTRFALNYEHTQQDSQFDRGLPAIRNRVTLDRDKYYGEDWARYIAEVHNGTFRAEHDFSDWFTARQMVNYTFGSTYRQVPNGTSVNAAGTLLNRQALRQFEEMDALDLQTEGVSKFNTGSIGHTLLTGYEYINADRTINQYNATLAAINLNNPAYGARPGTFSFQNRPLTRINMHALYLQDQIKLDEQWDVLAGLRHDMLDQTSITSGRGTMIDRTNTSPRLGVVYKPVPPLSLYTSYSTSFSPQTSRLLNEAVPEPEKAVQYEAGAKYDLVPDKLSVGMAVFEITKENVATPSTVTGFNILTGEVRSRGIEFDVTGEILPGWRVIGGAGYLIPEITKDASTASNKGNRPGGIPDVTATLWTSYQFQSGELKGLGAGIGATYVGQRAGDNANSYSVGSYTRWDSSIWYELTQNLRVTLTGRNLTDREYIEQTVTSLENLPGAPRTVIAGISAKF